MRKSIVRFDDVKGKTFNYMTVESEESPILVHGSKGDYSSRRWKFRCICGKSKIMEPSAILSGVTKSCGCMRASITAVSIQKYYKKKFITPVESRLYGGYKSDAKKSNREFSLTIDEFISIVNSDCYYCGTPPFQDRGNKTKSVIKPLNGIDRVDNTRGYTSDNVVPCCVYCNKAKLDRTITDFKVWISHIYTNLNLENDSIQTI